MDNLADFDLQRVRQVKSDVEEAIDDVRSEKEDVEKMLKMIDRKFKDLQTARANLEQSIELKNEGDDEDARERLKVAVRMLNEAREIDEEEVVSGINEIMQLDKQQETLEDSATTALANLAEFSGTRLDETPE